MTTDHSGMIPLGTFKPPKPISQMSEAELDAFAHEVATTMRRRLGQIVDPVGESAGVPDGELRPVRNHESVVPQGS